MPTYTPEKVEFGTSCPDFHLKATDGKHYSRANFINSKPLVVMFICNHCPYVKAIEERLITLAQDLKKIDVNVVAICANDPQSYPEDSFDSLRARALEKSYPFIYLHDEDQSVAKKFGAVCTPDFFVYDASNKLAYRGRLDDSWKDESAVTTRELYRAVLDLHANKPISFQQTPSMGCSIKWLKETP